MMQLPLIIVLTFVLGVGVAYGAFSRAGNRYVFISIGEKKSKPKHWTPSE